MKSKCVLLIIIPVLLVTSCSMNVITNADNTGDRVLITPAVLFKNDITQVSPDSVAIIIITVTYQSHTVKDTFNFNDHTGTLSTYIPTNTQFTLRIEGVDSNGKVIYFGEQLFFGATADTTITISANQVTPQAPENLTARALENAMVLLSWEDKSSNENGFRIRRSTNNDSSYYFLATTGKDVNNFIDSTAKPHTVYYYMIAAYNNAGISDSTAAKFDPLEVVETPVKPSGDTNILVDAIYFFKTDSISCGNGHLVEYRFDWGDSTTSPWSFSQAASHTWSAAGTYTIKVQARCSVNQDVISEWSEGLVITVSESGITEKIVKTK